MAESLRRRWAWSLSFLLLASIFACGRDQPEPAAAASAAARDEPRST